MNLKIAITTYTPKAYRSAFQHRAFEFIRKILTTTQVPELALVCANALPTTAKSK